MSDPRFLQPPPLGVSDEEAQRRFDELQAGLVDQWRLIGGFNAHEQTMVVVPSVSMEIDFPGSVLQTYEERLLFLLLLLRKPRARIIYVTSLPILPEIVDYYISLLAGVIPSHARSRLHTLAALDATSRPLAQKVLERPRLIERIRALIPDPSTAHLVPFNTTILERDLALRLGIPMYGADPRLAPLGSKSGARRIFREEGIPQADGVEDVHTIEECIVALRELRRRHPTLSRAIVKLNEGVSGLGNAEVDLTGLPHPDEASDAALRERLEGMQLESPGLTVQHFFDELQDGGGVVEQRLIGAEIRSPSTQARITPLGEVQILSTHDQLLGGASGQSFLGARFPADSTYAVEIARQTLKVGERLRDEGVLGRFAVDFVTVCDDGGDWRVYAIEINLRKGGTTAPFLILEFLVHGQYDWENARFCSPGEQAKFYVGDDHVEFEALKALTPDDVLDITARNGLHYDHRTQKGVVYQMLSAVTEQGRVGFTAVADSPGEAEGIWQRMRRCLEAEATEAAKDPGLPAQQDVGSALRRGGSAARPPYER